MKLDKMGDGVQITVDPKTLECISGWGEAIRGCVDSVAQTILQGLGVVNAEQYANAAENLLTSAQKIAETIDGSPELSELTEKAILDTASMAQDSIQKVTEKAMEVLDLPAIQTQLESTIQEAGNRVGAVCEWITTTVGEAVEKGDVSIALEQVQNELIKVNAIGRRLNDGVEQLINIINIGATELSEQVLRKNRLLFGITSVITIPLALSCADVIISAFGLDQSNANVITKKSQQRSFSSVVNGSTVNFFSNNSLPGMASFIRTATVVGAVWTTHSFSSACIQAIVEANFS